MNLFRLSLSYIRTRRLDTLLNVLLLALGVATIVVLLLFRQQFAGNLQRNAEGIDLVVGAKGSPIQLILSAIYHMDSPTGNIPLEEAEALTRSPAIAKAIPLSLGDNYHGYRIVGTRPDYVEHYGGKPAAGRLWQDHLEVVLGSDVAASEGLGLGDEVVSAHGLDISGDEHGDLPLTVVGILGPTGTVLDRVILSDLESVWLLHEPHDEESGDAEGMPAPPREITALLIKYASPMAAVIFPRYVNSQTKFQAASPAFETVRLFSLLGVGLDAIRAFGFLLILAAALSVFVSLYNSMKARRYDLAVMRSLGASKGTLLRHVLLEGLLVALIGTAAGLLLGHVAAEVLGAWTRDARQLELTGWTWLPGELWLVGAALLVGILAALLPAVQAYRTDIARTLARG